MHKFPVVVLAFTLICLGASSRQADGAGSPSPSAELEDQALSSVLENLGNLHYLSKGDLAQLRGLIDVSLHKHLSRLREHQGTIDGEDFRAAEIRTFNAVALLWEEHPPFTSESWRPTETNASWWPSWQAAHQKNLELLRWAKEQCTKKPELKCRASSKPEAEDVK